MLILVLDLSANSAAVLTNCGQGRSLIMSNPIKSVDQVLRGHFIKHKRIVLLSRGCYYRRSFGLIADNGPPMAVSILFTTFRIASKGTHFLRPVALLRLPQALP